MADTKRYTSEEVMKYVNDYRPFKTTKLREGRIIRSLYKGEFWQVFRKHLKDYTITPDWNYFEYVVQAFLNSVYSGAFIGTITPVNNADEEVVNGLNEFVSYMWNKWGMKNNYIHMGLNGELYNVGALRVDWDTETDEAKIRKVQFDELLLDPSVGSYKDGDALFIERAVNIDTLKRVPIFKDAVVAYESKNKQFTDKTAVNKIANYESGSTSTNRKISLIEGFIRNEQGKIDQVFLLDESEVIFEKLDLDLEQFPIVVYSPQPTDAEPYGTSKLSKILNTVIALNLLDSMEATQPHRLLNRVRFVNVDGRINMRSFADYGNTPGASFEVKGDPRNIVYFQDVPTVPDLTNLKNRLEHSIFQVTGVDPQYKGRMTNSLQTTGATEAFQARVTMLTDNSRITMLEEVTEDLTRILISYYSNYRKNTVYDIPIHSANGTNKVVDTKQVDFTKVKNTKFNYMISASTLLPMNQANLFQSTKALFEMQAQYGLQGKDRIVEAEDLIKYSDFPQKHLWLQKVAKKKQEDIAGNLVADLTNFASIFSKMLAKNMSEEEAAKAAIDILIQEKNAIMENPTIGQGFK